MEGATQGKGDGKSAQERRAAVLPAQRSLAEGSLGRSQQALLDAHEQFARLAAEVPPSVLTRVLSDAANIYRGAHALGAALSTIDAPVSPQMARSVQASINRWRQVLAEHRLLSSWEASEILGARPPNRAHASKQRTKGMLLGVKRGNAFIYPQFQVDEHTHRVRSVIPKLISLARANDWADESLLLWLVMPTGYFDDTRPMDHWDEPEGILDGARSRFKPAF